MVQPRPELHPAMAFAVGASADGRRYSTACRHRRQSQRHRAASSADSRCRRSGSPGTSPPVVMAASSRIAPEQRQRHVDLVEIDDDVAEVLVAMRWRPAASAASRARCRWRPRAAARSCRDTGNSPSAGVKRSSRVLPSPTIASNRMPAPAAAVRPCRRRAAPRGAAAGEARAPSARNRRRPRRRGGGAAARRSGVRVCGG